MDRVRFITVSVILPICSSLVMSNPVITNPGWIFESGSNEECTAFRHERMFQCLLRGLIPNKITGQCVEVNSQAQLRFERHPSVNILFLNMWDARNLSRIKLEA